MQQDAAHKDKMVNLIVGFPIWRCPSIFMDVAMWEHRTFDSEVFRCGKCTSLLIVGLKISTLRTVEGKKFRMVLREFIEDTF
jgi:hypothetical protein